MTEQEEFIKKAADAIYLQGVLVAHLKLDPDDFKSKDVERLVVNALTLLPDLANKHAEAVKELQLARHANVNLKVTISTLRARLKLFRDYVEELPVEVEIGTWRDGRKELLALHELP